MGEKKGLELINMLTFSETVNQKNKKKDFINAEIEIKVEIGRRALE